MKYAALLLLLILAAGVLHASCASCVFYSGDFDPNNPNANGLANETDAIVDGNPYGSATYQNFVSWDTEVTGLFTNDLMNDSLMTPPTAKAQPMAYWEIRSGVSEGNGGTLIASGTGFDTVTPTGRSGFGFNEYTNAVHGLNLGLPSGTFWFAVVPQAANWRGGRSFNSNTFGLNRIGDEIDNQQYWNSAFFGVNFTNANNDGVFPAFSGGVTTSCDCRLSEHIARQNAPYVPEPSSLILLSSGLIGVAVAARRRWFS